MTRAPRFTLLVPGLSLSLSLWERELEGEGDNVTMFVVSLLLLWFRGWLALWFDVAAQLGWKAAYRVRGNAFQKCCYKTVNVMTLSCSWVFLWLNACPARVLSTCWKYWDRRVGDELRRIHYQLERQQARQREVGGHIKTPQFKASELGGFSPDLVHLVSKIKKIPLSWLPECQQEFWSNDKTMKPRMHMI